MVDQVHRGYKAYSPEAVRVPGGWNDLYHDLKLLLDVEPRRDPDRFVLCGLPEQSGSVQGRRDGCDEAWRGAARALELISQKRRAAGSLCEFAAVRNSNT